MTTCYTIYRVAGDTGPDLESCLGVDISSMTISLALRYETGGEINKPAVVDDAAAGEFHFEWEATDLVEGKHALEYVIVNGSEVYRLPTESTLVLIVRAQA